MQRIYVEQCFDGDRFYKNAELVIDNGVVESLREISEDSSVEFIRGCLVPGFIDLQVNGGGGVLFCQQPTVETLATMLQAHRTFGTTHLLPTLITSDWSVMQTAANAVADYLQQPQSGILGIHFEGPHLSKERAGIHNPSKFQPLTDAHLALYTRKDLGKVLVTLAPEVVEPSLIKELTEHGVTVSLGHSNAIAEQVLAAVDAGARGATHLFNAMSPFNSRFPGMVGAILADPRMTSGVIVDGFHVHPLSVRAAINAKGIKKLCLVTDAMAHVGTDIDCLEFENSVICNHNGKLTNKDGRLAGSALTMEKAVQNAIGLCGLSLAESLTMASTTPAEFLGLSNLGKLKPGYCANRVLLDNQNRVIETWMDE